MLPIIVPLILGLLCFGIGLERADQFANIKRTLSDINTGVTNFGSVQFLTNYKRQFEIVGRIIDDTSRRLYILTFDLKIASLNTSTDAYKVYIDRVINSISRHPSLEYKVVFGIDFSSLSPEETDVLRNRKHSFVTAKIWNRVNFAYRELSVGLTILISDNTVVIGFPTLSRDPAPRNMIVLNKIGLADYIGEWYEKYIWTGSTVPPL